MEILDWETMVLAVTVAAMGFIIKIWRKLMQNCKTREYHFS